MNFKSALRPAYYRYKFTHLYGKAWARFLVQNHAWLAILGRRGPRGGIELFPGGLELTDRDDRALRAISGIEALQRLAAKVELIARLDGEAVELEIDGLRFRTEVEADMSVLADVFADRIYQLPRSEPITVLDFGGNIGATALYFAKNYDAVVESYELVPSTAAIAVANLALNPALASRIRIHAFGLGAADAQVEVMANANLRSSNSVQRPLSAHGAKRESAQVRDVKTVLPELDFPTDRKLVLKIDVEGAEYEILPAIAETGFLERVDHIFLEWHTLSGHDPQMLRDLIEAAGFEWREEKQPLFGVGMITGERPPTAA